MLRSLVSALVLFAAFSLSAKAQSTYTVDLSQDGSDVVATGSGNIDLDGVSFIENLTAQSDEFDPSGPIITLGVTPGGATLYYGITGPSNFGSGGNTGATTSSGDLAGISSTELLVPQGYTSGMSLSDTATWTGTTLADLGVTPGTYTWTWGTDSENTFTLNAVAVPEPCEYGWGILLAALGFVAWKRFSSRRAART